MLKRLFTTTCLAAIIISNASSSSILLNERGNESYEAIATREEGKNSYVAISMNEGGADFMARKGIQNDSIPLPKKKASKITRYLKHLAVGIDLVGPMMYKFGDQGDYQAFAQANINGKYFPTVEIGFGKANKTDFDTNVTYKAKAPFGRIGCDVNILKNKNDDYRLVIGLRYGFTSFDYDTTGPVPENSGEENNGSENTEGENTGSENSGSGNGNNGTSGNTFFGNTRTANPPEIVTVSDKCKVQWAEVVFGADAKVWGGLHMGWSLRYRKRLSCSDYVNTPIYAPGYGDAGQGSRFMALYTVSFQF